MSLKAVLRRWLANVRARGPRHSTHLGPLRFVLCGALLICARNAAAAPPFSVVAPTILATTVVADTLSTNCAAYNTRLSVSGVPAPAGVNHAGDCGFSSTQLLIDGQPAAQYWQQVSSGAIQAPYRTTFSASPSSRHGFCAVAGNLGVQLSVQAQPTVLSWPKASMIGGACALETSRHDPLPVIRQSAAAATTLRAMAAYLNNAVANHSKFEVCLDQQRTPHAQRLATAKLAKMVATEMQALLAAPRVRSPQAKWNRGVGVANNCALRCNQCASGWAGTITNVQVVKDKADLGQFLANETDTYFVGGTATLVGNTTTYPADWTSTGSGFNMDGNKQWILNATASGACPGSVQHVCVKVITDMTTGARLFTETNGPLSINGYQWAQNGGPLMNSAAGENPFATFITISASAADTMAAGHQVVHPAHATDCTLPPLASGTLECTQTWDWKLFLQP